MVATVGKVARAGSTRERILVTAERLFAEHGVYAVSNRQISEAAGQGNNAAVGYHFGAKADLVRAIARKHAGRIELTRTRMVEQVGADATARDWVECLVRPVTDHLAELSGPTWFARFAAQVMTDPALRGILIDEALSAPALHRILHGLDSCLPHLPAAVRAERDDMARQLMVHTCAERERALAEGAPTPRPDWHAAGTGLVDAIVGVWLAPSTSD
ncbi:TetR/AcrR family transcriptional regulator [Amycolatopsis sp. FDAARGOS 1241]|uniref:TetR/AcrR family transcriptional regulator n=1 Tax=Amycolatopsis sp. FDAARGOS 1241 TaxID=2778070 RepID=UPI001950FED3|nr:TetR/AcrR family transcriptional regulator [Amycolatopsis sp. FDAARGOS 1241]QRP49532.1 TetR family transcriptional regulator [Amycolatopsis sp. FDAARGOS 1241]